MKQESYTTVRERMQPGDLIAFEGTSLTSWVIKKTTRSNISHVGTVMTAGWYAWHGGGWGLDLHKAHTDRASMLSKKYTEWWKLPLPGQTVMLCESTTLNGAGGVRLLRMSEALEMYWANGSRVYHYPLTQDAQEDLDAMAFYDFMLRQVGKRYDVGGAVKAGLDPRWVLRRLLSSKEDLDRLFCSELVTAGWMRSNLKVDAEPSEIEPGEVIALPVVDRDAAVEVVR